MKTLLFSILLAFVTLVSQAQTTSSTTTANTALKTFEDAWLSINYDGMTSAQKTTHIQNWVGLKIAAAKENDLNRINAETEATAAAAAQTAAEATAKQQYIDKLKSLGYLCDNSQADWYKLYNRPAIFGSTWQDKANYQKSISTGVDYFLSVSREILFMPYQIGTPYKIGDTFVYAGELYEVVQAHTSQSDWIPSAVPALYKKAVLPATIAPWVQPTEAQDAYKIGDKVTFNGFTYESLINANVWSPTGYPAGWEKL
jgi:hypothetical protein